LGLFWLLSPDWIDRKLRTLRPLCQTCSKTSLLSMPGYMAG